MFASSGDGGEGIHIEDIFELVSLIISWTFRILAHKHDKEDQYTEFCL